MNKGYKIIIIILLSLLLSSCNNTIEEDEYQLQREMVDTYLQEHDRKSSYYEIFDEKIVLIDRLENSYEIKLLDTNTSSGELLVYQGEIIHSEGAIIGRVIHNHVQYTGVYLESLNLKEKVAEAIILFEKEDSSNGPYKIQRSLNGLDGLIIEQDLNEHNREIESISLVDDRNYDLLTIQE